MRVGLDSLRRGLTLESLAIAYLALPNAIFLYGWIVWPLGPLSAIALAILVAWVVLRQPAVDRAPAHRSLWIVAGVVATAWCVISGVGHIFFANSDWWVRDAVLLDLVRDHWPVTYRLEGVDTLLRAPLGFYLPAAVIGKVFGTRAADLSLLAWMMLGVFITFAFMLADRPSWKSALLRILIFVFFSGMDIVPTVVRDYPREIGAMIEWWARFIQYPSSTTLLFWAPNHALPGWIAVAWLLSRGTKAFPIRPAILFVALMPMWAPLTALGLAPLVTVAILRQLKQDGVFASLPALIDPRVVAAALICVALIFPYLVVGGERIPIGMMTDLPWVGEEYGLRYLEFILVEFVGFGVLLLKRGPADPLLWCAILSLLALPIFRFGPYNDLVMRGSIPALTLLAIYLGRWLATAFRGARDQGDRVFAGGLLAIGAVTPFMEIARAFILPAWPMNTTASLVEITHGAHYLTPVDHPWIHAFLRLSGS